VNSAIFLDANVFVYSVGRDHPLKNDAKRVLALVPGHVAFFTDAEVFQELLHRYLALRSWEEMRSSFSNFLDLMSGRIEAMLAEDVDRAAQLATAYPLLSARDLIHVAVIQRVGATHIVSADTDFDTVDSIERLDPLRVDEWRSLVPGN
jgi:predicted nucleic acid-binding protein